MIDNIVLWVLLGAHILITLIFIYSTVVVWINKDDKYKEYSTSYNIRFLIAVSICWELVFVMYLFLEVKDKLKR